MKKVVVLILISLLIPNLPNVIAQTFTDPKADLTDKKGNHVPAEEYLDIIESEIIFIDDNYIGTIKLNNDIPSKTEDSSLFIEWDLMIDSDKNPATIKTMK